MLVGCIIHRSSDGRRLQRGVVCTRWHCHLGAEPGSAAPLLLDSHPGAWLVGAVVVSLERVTSEVTVQVNTEMVALVLFCVLFFNHLPVVSAIAVDPITYTLFLVSAKIQYGTMTVTGTVVLPGLPVGISGTAQMWVEETCNFLLTCIWNTKWIILFWGKKKSDELVKVKEMKDFT